MSEIPYLRIEAKDVDRFNRRLLAFSYLLYLSQGRGAVLVQKSDIRPKPDGSLAATVRYLPSDRNSAMFAPPTKAILESYDPENEIVLAVADRKDKATFAQMATGNERLTPKILGKEWAMGELAMPWLPGRVLALEEDLPGLRKGRYEFVWRDGDSLRLRRFKDGETVSHASGSPASAPAGSAESFRPLAEDTGTGA